MCAEATLNSLRRLHTSLVAHTAALSAATTCKGTHTDAAALQLHCEQARTAQKEARRRSGTSTMENARSKTRARRKGGKRPRPARLRRGPDDEVVEQHIPSSSRKARSTQKKVEASIATWERVKEAQFHQQQKARLPDRRRRKKPKGLTKAQRRRGGGASCGVPYPSGPGRRGSSRPRARRDRRRRRRRRRGRVGRRGVRGVVVVRGGGGVRR